MIESPLIRELMAEQAHDHILRFLRGRFGAVPTAIAAALRTIQEKQLLDSLVDWASQCPDLAAFRARLPT